LKGTSMTRCAFHLLAALLFLVSACQQHARLIDPSDLHGTWGGEGLVMTVGPGGATLEYDCARATVDEEIIPDAQGVFLVSGTHSTPSLPVGGIDAPLPNVQAAHFSGRVNGGTMFVTSALDASGTILGPSKLSFGAPGSLHRCL